MLNAATVEPLRNLRAQIVALDSAVGEQWRADLLTAATAALDSVVASGDPFARMHLLRMLREEIIEPLRRDGTFHDNGREWTRRIDDVLNLPTSDDAPLVRDGRTTSWSAAANRLRFPAPGAADGDALRAAARRAAEGRGSAPELARLWRDAVIVGRRGRSPRVADVDAVDALWRRGATPSPRRTANARR